MTIPIIIDVNLAGPAVSDKGRYIPRYKLSCHKQVSDPKNVKNCRKQVLTNRIVWNSVSNILQNQYIIFVNKNAKKTFLSFFTFIKSLYCNTINVSAFYQKYIIIPVISYLRVITIIVLNCLKLSVCTGLGHSWWQFMMRLVINRFQTVWNPTLQLRVIYLDISVRNISRHSFQVIC